MRILMILLAVLSVVSARAQVRDTPDNPAMWPSFEVASIKQNKLSTESQPALRYTPSGVDFARVPITWLIGEAYQIPYYSQRLSASDADVRQLLSSPGYRYDVSARASQATSQADLRLMLRSLLADRFKLTMHHSSTLESVYKLVVGRSGPKIRQSENQSDVGQPIISARADAYEFKHIEMAKLSGFLSSQLDRPVVDFTGLKGFYDFTLNWQTTSADDKSAIRDMIASAILSNIEPQLGLKLETGKQPIDSFVVDHLEPPSED